MNAIINDVLNRKNDILEKTLLYEKLNTENISHDHRKEYAKLYDYFDKNFNEDEIKVVQAIMYFGRDCYPNGNPECGGSVEEIINRWMRNLCLSFEKNINKEIEIDQMVEKGLKIGTYFKLAFEYFDKSAKN